VDTVDKSKKALYIGRQPRIFLDVGLAAVPKPDPPVERIPITHPQPYQQKWQEIRVFHILEKHQTYGYIWGVPPP